MVKVSTDFLYTGLASLLPIRGHEKFHSPYRKVVSLSYPYIYGRVGNVLKLDVLTYRNVVYPHPYQGSGLTAVKAIGVCPTVGHCIVHCLLLP